MITATRGAASIRFSVVNGQECTVAAGSYAPPVPRGRAHSRHAWLAAVLPAGARRVRAADAAIAETLRQAGAEEGGDVQIGPVAWITDEARCAIVPFDVGPPSG